MEIFYLKLVNNSTHYFDNFDFTYTFIGGDGSIFSYSLVLSNTTPLTYSCNFFTSKTIEICQVIVKFDKIGFFITNTKTLPKKACLTLLINNQPRYIGSHADVIIFLAIPYWITEAARSVNFNKTAPSWLITVNLLKQSHFEFDEFFDNSIPAKFLPFSFDNFKMAIIESVKQARKNPYLSQVGSRIPEAYKKLQESQFKKDEIITPAKPYLEPSFQECIMDERKAEGRDLGGAK